MNRVLRIAHELSRLLAPRIASGETVTPETVKWWSQYASRKLFKTPEEARQWMFERMEHADRSGFMVSGPEKNRAKADAIPLYQSGKSWKIGKRIRKDLRFRLSSLQVRKPSLEYLDMVANSNTELDFEYEGVKWLRIKDLIEDTHYAYDHGREKEYIQDLAYRIKTNGWIEAVVVGQAGNEYELWEGQHRVRALRALGFSTVPAYIVRIEEDPEYVGASQGS